MQARRPLLATTVALLALTLVPSACESNSTLKGLLAYPYGRECPEAGITTAVDRWYMNTCNCTSYAAWMLDDNGQRVDWFQPGKMDAHNWPRVARAADIPLGSTPKVGAVAVWPKLSPPYGHIGYVTAVRADGTFDVAEYNLLRPYRFEARYRVSATGVTFVYVPRR